MRKRRVRNAAGADLFFNLKIRRSKLIIYRRRLKNSRRKNETQKSFQKKSPENSTRK